MCVARPHLFLCLSDFLDGIEYLDDVTIRDLHVTLLMSVIIIILYIHVYLCTHMYVHVHVQYVAPKYMYMYIRGVGMPRQEYNPLGS